MDALMLSRLQFAVTSMFHFIFVPLTLGISVMIAWMETRYVISGDELWLRMAKFWGKLFLINFALGIVTGITMEFQFGMNWAEYSRYVGDIFGAPLAIESTVAFFLESVFIGLWIFGWKKVSPKVHALSIWLVAIATNLSGLWILLANGWMQHPVGFVLRNNRAEMVDFMALITNPTGLIKFGHQIVSGYTVAAFFVMGVSAWHLLRNNELDFFKRSFRQAALFGLVSAVLVALMGDAHAVNTAVTQPAKFAAMESIWETQKGVGMNLFLLPDEKRECNAVERLCVPNMVSMLAFHNPDAVITGLKDIPKELRPPVLPVFLSFRTMVGLGTYFILASLLAVFLSRRQHLEKQRLFLTILVFSIPLPYLANQLGWIVAELGRQPWIVYGVLKTADAVSKHVTTAQVAVSLAGFTLLYGSLGVMDIYLLNKYARKGPEHDLSGIIPAKGRN
ncbi:cytochrome ubiquinol oxidase subunit I [Geobacter sp. SVR]|uniref:cytochrome ubiquinol oxidase subunit I n=1 Tax=Geobacter sp. SVR TaxID=2495594 RepID=UPI00143EF7B7|nr:cytochrome ubiquinol oxidase subunit I [Geobacter sp. SVR]BCS52989.1 cytochrome ubiquinol oxidase subunit I [Geobacter sp. SVR]GCF84374.1 cytochrome ubiquinol oxidase subunit I [Geobacter sp. SVR]